MSSCCVLAAAASSRHPRRPAVFTDVTARRASGSSTTTAPSGKKYLPETLGVRRRRASTWTATAGRTCCSSTRRTGRAARARSRCPALYRNNQDGTFADVTRGSGLDVEMYGIGGAAADFDNDGKVDVYLTALGGNRLFRNLGGGKFADVTGERRRRRARLLDQRALVRLRQRRQARSVRRALRRLVDREGPLLHARRQEQVVLHAGILQGAERRRCSTTAATAPSRT